MIWTDKFKFMGPCTLDDEERGGGDTEEGVIVMDVSNVNMIEGMAKTLSETPIEVVSPDLRTLRDRDSNGGSMIRVVSHTLGMSGLHNLLTCCGTLEEQWLGGGGLSGPLFP